MLKRLCIVYLLCTATAPLFALPGFASLDAETKANTREGAAVGGGLSFGLDLNRHFCLGLKTAFTFNLDTVSALEPTAIFRYYLPLKISGPFVQAELGAVVFFEYGKAYPAPLGGVSAGWRFNLAKNWYLEPAFRTGYPFIWGASLSTGLRFGADASATSRH